MLMAHTWNQALSGRDLPLGMHSNINIPDGTISYYCIPHQYQAEGTQRVDIYYN